MCKTLFASILSPSLKRVTGLGWAAVTGMDLLPYSLVGTNDTATATDAWSYVHLLDAGERVLVGRARAEVADEDGARRPTTEEQTNTYAVTVQSVQVAVLQPAVRYYQFWLYNQVERRN